MLSFCFLVQGTTDDSVRSPVLFMQLWSVWSVLWSFNPHNIFNLCVKGFFAMIERVFLCDMNIILWLFPKVAASELELLLFFPSTIASEVRSFPNLLSIYQIECKDLMMISIYQKGCAHPFQSFQSIVKDCKMH